jgi:hypothetical protein
VAFATVAACVVDATRKRPAKLATAIICRNRKANVRTALLSACEITQKGIIEDGAPAIV